MSVTRNRLPAFWILILFVGALTFVPIVNAQQARSPSHQAEDHAFATLVVNVRAPDGSPIDLNCVVNLRSFTGAVAGIGTLRGGTVEFNNIGTGRYSVEVDAPGYKKLAENVELVSTGGRQQVFLMLTPESGASTSQPAAAPLLAPKAQKEFNQALEAIRANKCEEARKHLEKVSRVAPSNPDVNYLWGMYWAEASDWDQARIYWEKAVQIYPKHSSALAALAQQSMNTGDVPSAITYLSRAVDASPSAWRFQEHLAEAYLVHGESEQAEKYARRAVELGKDRALQAQLILAQALVQQHKEQPALKALDIFLAESPSNSQKEAARALLAGQPEPQPSDDNKTSSALRGSIFTLNNTSAKSLAADLAPPPKWMPRDVDEEMPSVDAKGGCPMAGIRESTGNRVREFIDAVNRISATESLEDDLIGRGGLPKAHVSRTYSYVATLEEIRPGAFSIDEYRNGTLSLEIFPEHVATIGLSSLVMIFHPAYQEDYELSCEGLTHLLGLVAWQVHFRQKPTKPARLREYRVGTGIYPVSLRGRAWIDTKTFQVLKIETDLVSPVQQIGLKAEHTSVDYQPVAFRTRDEQLWLPQNAELFFDFNGRRMHRRHNFRDYQLFAVDEKERMYVPSITATEGNNRR